MTRRLVLALSLALTIVVMAAVTAIGDERGWFSSPSDDFDGTSSVMDVQREADEAVVTPTAVVEYVFQDFIILPSGQVTPAPPNFHLPLTPAPGTGAQR